MGLRDVARDRLLAEMVEGSVKDLPENEWTLLVVDETTTKVLSSVCSVSHLVEKRARWWKHSEGNGSRWPYE